MEHVGTGSTPEAGGRRVAFGPTHTAQRTPAQRTPARPHWLVRQSPFWLVVFGLLWWEWAAQTGQVSTLFFPAPTTIGETLFRLLVHDTLLNDTGTTLYRLSLSLALGGLAGVWLGLLMGWSIHVRTIAEPFVAAIHPLPKSSMLPLLLVLMGIGESPRVTLVMLTAFFPLLISAMGAVRNIEPALLEAAANYGARGVQLFRRVIVPASLPGILSGLRISLNAAFSVTITTELLISRQGLGARIWMAWETMRTENLYAALLMIAAVGILSNWLLALVTRRLTPWAPGMRLTRHGGSG